MSDPDAVPFESDPFTDPFTLPFVRRSAPVVHHGGVDYCWLVRGQDTGGQLAVAEVVLGRSDRAAACTHSHEDLLLIGLEGELAVSVGSAVQGTTGRSVIWLPRHVPHRVHAVSERARALLVVVPAGWESTVVELDATASPAMTWAAYAAAGVHRDSDEGK